MQHQTDLNTMSENRKQADHDFEVSGKKLIVKDGILCKAECPKQKESWTITKVHANGTIRVTGGTRLERLNFQVVEPFFENGN